MRTSVLVALASLVGLVVASAACSSSTGGSGSEAAAELGRGQRRRQQRGSGAERRRQRLRQRRLPATAGGGGDGVRDPTPELRHPGQQLRRRRRRQGRQHARLRRQPLAHRHRARLRERDRHLPGRGGHPWGIVSATYTQGSTAPRATQPGAARHPADVRRVITPREGRRSACSARAGPASGTTRREHRSVHLPADERHLVRRALLQGLPGADDRHRHRAARLPQAAPRAA